MTNPFVYGEIVPSAAFVDREVELDRLARDLYAGQKVFLISPRRYGKSSLVRQALRSVGRSGALRTNDVNALLAPVDKNDKACVDAERRLFANLKKVPFDQSDWAAKNVTDARLRSGPPYRPIRKNRGMSVNSKKM